MIGKVPIGVHTRLKQFEDIRKEAYNEEKNCNDSVYINFDG